MCPSTSLLASRLVLLPFLYGNIAMAHGVEVSFDESGASATSRKHLAETLIPEAKIDAEPGDFIMSVFRIVGIGFEIKDQFPDARVQFTAPGTDSALTVLENGLRAYEAASGSVVSLKVISGRAIFSVRPPP